uniref:Citramalyl-CoA lyase n=1 Tax=Chrysemys picta bellii TaxID=8478 RepID=A0A8C3HY06_CHRPI
MAAAVGALRLLLAGPGLRRRRLKTSSLSAGVPKLDYHSKPSHKYVPRRAVLYVPADDERKIQKIPSLNVDCAVLDCEDGVALNRKAEARLTVVKTLKEVEFGQTEKCVRINSVSSGLAEQDLEVLLRSSVLPSSLMLPKVENAEEIRWSFVEDKNDTIIQLPKDLTGKQVIHPNQIAVVQEQFSPSPEKIKWAQELISAFEDHQRLGKGAFTFHGSMIDMPLLKQAQNIVTLATAIKKK